MHNAKKGGEFGANGEWYKGGQFVADKEDTVKGLYMPKGPRKVCIAPYEWVEADWDKYGIWGEIKDFVAVESKWNEETRKSEVVCVNLSLPIECYDVNAAVRSTRTAGRLKTVDGYEKTGWFKRHRAYYGSLLARWIEGERFISESELANLAKACDTGRRCYRGCNKIGIADVATIADCDIGAAYETAYAKSLTVKTTEEYRKSLFSEGGYIGEIGEKVSFVGTVKFLKSFDGIYGTSFIVKFADGNGNAVVWFASNPPDCIEEGAKVNVTGTVKNHNERDGEKQTVVTRCKVQLAA